MINNFQNADDGSNETVLESFYWKLLRPIPEKSLKILDMGSGTILGFEKFISEKRRSYKDTIDCMDINKPDSIPDYIRRFYQEDITEVFHHDQYDVIFALEVIEHVDRTEMVLKNAYDNLRSGGLLILSHPNLSSLMSRIELLLGYQPHILEASNESSRFGGGVFSKLNSGGDTIHHIRGITFRAMKDMLKYYRFKVERNFGNDNFFKFLSDTRYASLTGWVCRKI